MRYGGMRGSSRLGGRSNRRRWVGVSGSEVADFDGMKRVEIIEWTSS